MVALDRRKCTGYDRKQGETMSYVLLVLFGTWMGTAFAGLPVLDRPYKDLQHPVRDMTPFSQRALALPAKSDLQRTLQTVTEVRDQAHRGTCSIFSATALVESLMIQSGFADRSVDMSEEWLQYLTTLQISEEGSDSPANFRLLRKHGIPTEKEMPYVGTDWTSKSRGLAAKRCGHLERGADLKACLISHRDRGLIDLSDKELLNPISHLYDPEFVTARESAKRYRDLLFAGTERGGIVHSVNEIHLLLAQGTPLTLEFDFYYGSWNHPEATKYGINRSPRLWREGTVTHPDPGSADLANSKRSPSGHSVLVVGYDDEREVQYWVRMQDGSKRKVSRKGVYYFKNSWGKPKDSSDWGWDFTIEGRRYPGYGMILQDHAHDHGQFFRLNMN